jgi:hypothetical protein
MDHSFAVITTMKAEVNPKKIPPKTTIKVASGTKNPLQSIVNVKERNPNNCIKN